MSESIHNPLPGSMPEKPARTRWWVWGVIAFLSLHLTLILGYTGLDYLYHVWPDETYQLIYERPWLNLNVRALNFQSEKDFSKAQAALSEKADKTQNPIPHFLLAELENSLDQQQDAVQQYKATIATAQKDWLSRIQYREYQDNAHAALAILAYEQGNNSQAHQELAKISDIEINRESELLSSLRDVLDEPERGDFHLLLGKAFRKALKFKMAYQELQKAEQLSQSPQLRLEIANFTKTQMPNSKGQDLSPMARYYGLAGRSAQTDDENLPKAASLFKKAVREDPQFEWGYNELAIIYMELKDYHQATAYAENAITQHAEFYNPYLTLGDIALDQQNFQGAVQHFQDAEAILQKLPAEDEQSIMANLENELGYAYESLHNYPKADEHYRNALSISAELDDNATRDYTYAKDALARVSRVLNQATKQTPTSSIKQVSLHT